jgi:hypothetical protein
MEIQSDIDKFNETLTQFINDLKKICPNNSDLFKCEQIVNIILVKSTKKIVISNFQAFVLRDDFVRNILNKNTDFFIKYNFSNDNKTNISIIERTQKIVLDLQNKNDEPNIKCVFNWIILLVYFAYSDLGINPDEKFKNLLQK